MIAEKLNTVLIEEMKDRLAPGMNLANLLMDILCIGKEAVYRRLRGEVPFTLAETVVVARRLNISLDKLVGAEDTHASFKLTLTEKNNPLDNYLALLTSNTETVKEITAGRNSKMELSSGTLPLTFYLKYETLSKFRFFKWMYQKEKQSTVRSLHEFELPDEIKEIQRQYIAASMDIHTTCYVWDDITFQALVKDVLYFASINLIRQDEVKRIKAELTALLQELESLATKGTFDNGNELQIYVSNINFEATYCTFENSASKLSLIRLFDVNYVRTTDEKMFVNVKEWLQSLKKFSTMISQSGEMQRIQYFNKQKDIIDGL